MKIVHIITGLGDGGAEHTLYKVCKYDKNNEHGNGCNSSPLAFDKKVVLRNCFIRRNSAI